MKTDAVSETCFLVSGIPDDGYDNKTVLLSVMHHHQNPLECTQNITAGPM
jgi:hypothetical protein